MYWFFLLLFVILFLFVCIDGCYLLDPREFCVIHNLGQDALLKEIFNLNVLFKIKVKKKSEIK